MGSTGFITRNPDAHIVGTYCFFPSFDILNTPVSLSNSSLNKSSNSFMPGDL